MSMIHINWVQIVDNEQCQKFFLMMTMKILQIVDDDLICDKNVRIVYAFSTSSKRTRIKIPDSVTIIQDYAFSYSKNVREIILPEKLIRIGYCSFYTCGLMFIYIPESVLFIAPEAFMHSAKLEKVDILFQCNISARAFASCTNLKSVYAPNVSKIDSGV